MGMLKDYFRRKFPQQGGEEINVDGIRYFEMKADARNSTS
jgi:hypothetical protein